MKQRRISAIALVLILLLGNICFAETTVIDNMGALAQSVDVATVDTSNADVNVQPEPDVAAPTATVAPTGTIEPITTPEPVVEPVVTPTPAPQPKQVYFLLFDCGYALYGEKSFERSVVKTAGDPEGRIIDFVRANIANLLAGEDLIQVYGYHSELIKTTKELAQASDVAAVNQKFEELVKVKPEERQSSKLDVALNQLLNEIDDVDKAYDLHLVIFSGGVVNYYNGKPDSDLMFETLDKLRRKEVTIEAVGLNVEGAGLISADEAYKDAPLAKYFEPSEYMAADVPVFDGQPDYTAARLNMMDKIVVMFRADDKTRVERLVDFANIKFVEGDNILTWNYDVANKEPQVNTFTPEEYQTISANATQSPEQIDWVIGIARHLIPEPTKSPEEIAEENNANTVINRLKEIKDELSGTVLDVGSGEPSTYDLTDAFDTTQFAITSSDECVEVEVTDNKLIIKPIKAGTANIVNTYIKKDKAMGVTVKVIDSRLEVNDDGAGKVTATSYDGMLSWTVEVIQGVQKGMHASGSAINREACSLEGVSWQLSEDGRIIDVIVQDVGEYKITFNLELADGSTRKEESRAIIVSHAADPVTVPVELITPYFKQQESQSIVLTSGGQPIDLDDYSVSISPEGVLNVYHGEDESSLYVVPTDTGLATVTIKEKYVDSTPMTFTVSIVSLTSNPWIWVCGAGAVIALMALTAGVVILIGKGANRRRGD